MSITYLRCPEKWMRLRFYAECEKRGYEYVPSWPSSDGPWDDPGFPETMPQSERDEIYQAIFHPTPHTEADQHPEFKYLRVKV